jgi:hypothetical protein
LVKNKTGELLLIYGLTGNNQPMDGWLMKSVGLDTKAVVYNRKSGHQRRSESIKPIGKIGENKDNVVKTYVMHK